MTGAQHYAKAEALLRRSEGEELDWAAHTVAQAQVHATLALAASSALLGPVASDYGLGEAEFTEWRKTATA